MESVDIDSAAAHGAGAYSLVTALIYYLIDNGVIDPSEFAKRLDRNSEALEHLGIQTDLETKIHQCIENVIMDLHSGVDQQHKS